MQAKNNSQETTILLVRHGQSEGNVLGVFTGHSGYPLTDLGHKQAEMTAKYIGGNYCVDAVYSSDLPRAFQTAEHTARVFGLPIVTDCRLREINAGKWENIPFSELSLRFPEAYAVWREDLIHFSADGGESVMDVANRAVDALHAIAAANSGKCVVVVAHATTIRTALWKISGMPKSAMQELSWGGNCAISELCFSDGKLQIKAVNFTNHLAGFESVLPKNI